MIYTTKDLNLDKTGNKEVTKELQALIDSVGLGDTLVIDEGIYLVASLFLKSDMTLVLDENAVLRATTNEKSYVVLPTRVAGVEMPWYVGILNCIALKNVVIGGEGKIDGNGPYWWSKYWGVDTKGGMREVYDSKNLRWACDYDCMRPRNVVIQNCENIILEGFTSYQAGFWNVHVLYSHDITIKKIRIDSCEENSPSTDGIDIDSSYNVIISECSISCNDDAISIKSGRDYDGHRVGIPCHDIEIFNCNILKGFGITMGSEITAGIYNVIVHDIRFHQTDCGFRIKSSRVRKGYIKNIRVWNLELLDVAYIFHMVLNWNPLYCTCDIPKDYKGELPRHYEILCKKLEGCNTVVDGIHFKNISAKISKEYTGISRCFNIEGFLDSPIQNILFEDMNIVAKEYGILNHVKNIQFKDCMITAEGSHISEHDSYDNR